MPSKLVSNYEETARTDTRDAFELNGHAGRLAQELYVGIWVE